MAQLQTDLHALQQQHWSQVAQMGRDRESLLAHIQALEDQSGQLQGKLEMQRWAFTYIVKSREEHNQQTTSSGPLVKIIRRLPIAKLTQSFCCLCFFSSRICEVYVLWVQAERTCSRRRCQAAA